MNYQLPKKLTLSSKLSTIPPPLRRRSDFYRPTMDALIDNDTRATHFQLSGKDSRSLLDYIYPDALLFLRAEGNLTIPGSAKQKQAFTVGNILEYCRQVGLYGKPTKKGCTRDMWLSNCPPLGPRASTEREAPLALFFNTVLNSIQTTCSKLEFMYVRPLLVAILP